MEAEDQEWGEGEEETASGVLVPPRDESGTPSSHDEDLTEEAAEAIDTELPTGESVDEHGRPMDTEPPAVGS